MTRIHKNTIHGYNKRGNRRPEYSCWAAMKSRCNNPNTEFYKYYGGKGITVCTRWESFSNFISDMGDMPGDSYSIERKDITKGYTPENCFWLPINKQGDNKSTNHILTHNNVSKNITQWEKELDFVPGTLKARILKGWDITRALTEPVRTNPYPKGIEVSKEGKFRVRQQINGKRITLYSGFDLFEACCVSLHRKK